MHSRIYGALWDRPCSFSFSYPSFAVATQVAMTSEATTSPVYLINVSDRPDIKPHFVKLYLKCVVFVWLKTVNKAQPLLNQNNIYKNIVLIHV